jgi:hypothetical protein
MFLLLGIQFTCASEVQLCRSYFLLKLFTVCIWGQYMCRCAHFLGVITTKANWTPSSRTRQWWRIPPPSPPGKYISFLHWHFFMQNSRKDCRNLELCLHLGVHFSFSLLAAQIQHPTQSNATDSSLGHLAALLWDTMHSCYYYFSIDSVGLTQAAWGLDPDWKGPRMALFGLSRDRNVKMKIVWATKY